MPVRVILSPILYDLARRCYWKRIRLFTQFFDHCFPAFSKRFSYLFWGYDYRFLFDFLFLLRYHVLLTLETLKQTPLTLRIR